jgi:hypothetical protein
VPTFGEAPADRNLGLDITRLPVRFWTVAKFSNYGIVYRPETTPLQVIAVLHGMRDLKVVLEGRR